MKSLINRFLIGLLAVRLGVSTAAVADDNVQLVVGSIMHDIPKNLFGVFFEEARAIAMLWLIGGKPKPEDLFSCRSIMQGKVGCMQVSSYLGPAATAHNTCLSPCNMSQFHHTFMQSLLVSRVGQRPQL